MYGNSSFSEDPPSLEWCKRDEILIQPLKHKSFVSWHLFYCLMWNSSLGQQRAYLFCGHACRAGMVAHGWTGPSNSKLGPSHQLPPGHICLCRWLPSRALCPLCHEPQGGRDLPWPCTNAPDTDLPSTTAGGVEAWSHPPGYMLLLRNMFKHVFKAICWNFEVS